MYVCIFHICLSARDAGNSDEFLICSMNKPENTLSTSASSGKCFIQLNSCRAMNGSMHFVSLRVSARQAGERAIGFSLPVSASPSHSFSLYTSLSFSFNAGGQARR